MREYGAEEVVLYLLGNLRCVYDRHKVVLLAFLAQYEVDGRLVYELTCGGRPLAKASFYIDCGVESGDVHRALKSGGVVKPPEEICIYGACYRAATPLPDICYTGPMPQLPKPVESRLRDVLELFGAWGRGRLARHIDRLLWLNPWKYYEYSGVDVHRYMADQGFRVVPIEKCRRDSSSELLGRRHS